MEKNDYRKRREREEKVKRKKRKGQRREKAERGAVELEIKNIKRERRLEKERE
jgi:hypothetical protein